MIATVRIAPVEQWCEWYLPPAGHEQTAAKLVGTPVQIETRSMRTARCDAEARMWDITLESCRRLDNILGVSNGDTNRGLCEHVLEMD